jgi:purine-nucleoside phosphorylase
VDVAAGRGVKMRVGPVLAADAFYNVRPDLYDALAEHGVLAVEMETAALYTIAARYGARAVTVLTVSDLIKTGEHLNASDREQSFRHMVEIGLETAARIET